MHSGRRFEDFARIGADWFWETDSNDRFTYFSVATSQMGLDLAGRIGRSRADFAFSDPDNFARLAVLEGVTLARQPYRNLVYRVAGEDPARWCSISGDPSFDSAGNFDGYRGVGRDVTALVSPKVLDVGKRIGDVTRLLKHGLGEGIILEVHVDPDLWPVEIDGTQFDSAITKLVNNACEGMPGGGTLNIVARNTSTDTAETPAADGILIEVTDTGTGMDKETLAQAFEPFFSTKEAGHGIGFGLSMVHGFVHQSGGEIRLQSIVGKGTTVRLMLPRAPERRTDPAKPVIGSSTSGGAERILFVEDNEYVRETVIGQLKSLGYHVSDVESGEVPSRSW